MKLRKAARGKKHVAAEAKLFSGVSYKKVNRSKVEGLYQKNVSYITPFIDWTNCFSVAIKISYLCHGVLELW